MSWQWPLVGLVLAAAVLYLLRSAWRTWRGTKVGCGGGCSCADKKKIPAGDTKAAVHIPLEQLTLRRHGPGRT